MSPGRPARPFGRDLLIHAGKVIQDDASSAVEALTEQRVPTQLSTGGVVGVIRLVEGHHASDCYMACSPWAEANSWALVLGRARPLPQRVPCPGERGLFHPAVAVAA